MRLGVNVDHIATVRQARRGRWPDPVEAAHVCEQSGASGIVCHLREDRRHIQDEDVRRLRQVVTTRLNLEMSIAKGIVKIALALRPDAVTLVPERRQELTTEGGLDVVKLSRTLPPIIEAFQRRHINVSLFVDPVPAQLRAVRDVGAAAVELHTGRYAQAPTARARARELSTLKTAARLGAALGLSVAAGHGLAYDNVTGMHQIPEIEEVNIGFSIIARALSIGLDRAVREMVSLLAPHNVQRGEQPVRRSHAAHGVETA